MQFKPIYLTYAQAASMERLQMLRISEIPTDEAISLPLPTLRWGRPAYAFFASPTLSSSTTITYSAPERWWVMNAHGGGLLIYARWDVQPYTTEHTWDDVEVSVEMHAESEEIEQVVLDLFETLTPAFFADKHADSVSRRELVSRFAHLFPSALLEQYQTLAPDFFAWLEN